jgi:DNA-directed RNA polymerase alpha subunit
MRKHPNNPIYTNTPLFTPLNKLNLSTRCYNALKNYDCEVLGDALQATDKELLKALNFGKACLREFREKYGYE